MSDAAADAADAPSRGEQDADALWRAVARAEWTTASRLVRRATARNRALGCTNTDGSGWAHPRDPLWRVVMGEGPAELVSALLAAGGDPNAVNAEGRSLVWVAAAADLRPDLVRALLGAGGDANAADAMGFTPLYTAAANDASVALVEALLDGGGDPCRAARDGTTPIHAAAQFASPPLLATLLERGGRASLLVEGPHTDAPLTLARRAGNEAVLRHLERETWELLVRDAREAVVVLSSAALRAHGSAQPSLRAGRSATPLQRFLDADGDAAVRARVLRWLLAPWPGPSEIGSALRS